MVRITEELVRKKSEHNELEICTLEELSLHQEHIEKIEHLQNWCKDLQILLLQANIISKIENLHKLKKLKYLNLALNNIEFIENLERCESLEKLDLTLNFIGNLESVKSLQNNINLKEIYLTGNPCTEFTGYRNYVIANLPQIENLDNTEISRSERIKLISSTEKQILKDQEKYLLFRNDQKIRMSENKLENVSDEMFWKQQSENCPEVRVEMAERQIRSKKLKEQSEKEETKIKLFKNDGKPLNINQPKLKFHIELENPFEFVLTLEIYRYLDTNLIDVDLQPNYVRVKIKEKIFQLSLPEEISISKSIAQRSQTTGFLVIRMPKLNGPEEKNFSTKKYDQQKEPSDAEKKLRREYLEIGPDRLTQICNIQETVNQTMQPDFIDDDSVPPLE